jgi:PKD repeat protein
MKHLFTWILALSFVGATAQISLTNADMPTAGWSQKVIKDTLPLPSFSFGNPGANQLYDFSAFSPYVYDTIEYRAPTGTQVTAFPNADLAITSDGGNFLYTKTNSTKLNWEGGRLILNGTGYNSTFSPVNDVYQFPTQYNNKFAGSWGFVQTLPGSAVNLPVNDVKVTFTANFKDTIDGWGGVKTPIGTYKCLRQKRVEISRTIIEFRLLPIGNYSLFSDTYDTTVRYNYLTKEAKGGVITFEYDSLDNVLSTTYSQIPPAAPVANFTFVNGSGGLVLFTDATDGYPDTYSWDFGDGTATSSAVNPNHVYAANGNYNVCLTVTNAGGSNTICKQVTVSGIIAGNNPPFAQYDTVSTPYATPVTINVGNNDVDPEGDSFCMTAIIGSAAFADAGIGNCTSITYTPDSTFSGNDTCYYIICDNGSPSLCDTGMLVVTVAPCVLPQFSLLALCGGLPVEPTGCFGLVTVISTGVNDSLTWTVNSLDPNVPFSTSLLKKDTITLIMSYGGGNGADIVTPENVYSYSVCGAYQNSCGTTTVCDTINVWWESLEKITLANIKLYPNPSSGAINIDLQENEQAQRGELQRLAISNIYGQEIQRIDLGDRQLYLTADVSNLANGMYLLTAINTAGQRVPAGRFVVSR